MIIYCSSCGNKQTYSGIKPKNCVKCNASFEKPIIEYAKTKKYVDNIEESEDEISLGFDLNPSSIIVSVDKKLKFEEINGGKNQFERPSRKGPTEDLENLLKRINNK